jgi:hypothetical protein
MPVEGIDPYSAVVPPNVAPAPPAEQAPPEPQPETVQEEGVGNNVNTTA